MGGAGLKGGAKMDYGGRIGGDFGGEHGTIPFIAKLIRMAKGS